MTKKKGIEENEKKDGEFVCEKCLKPIRVGERYSFIGTYDRKEDKYDDKIVSEYYYHLKCWTEYLREEVNSKIVEMSTQLSNALVKSPVFQSLKGMMGGTQ